MDKVAWTPSWFSTTTLAMSLDSLLTYTTGGGDCRAPLAMTCWDGWGTESFYGGDCDESEDDLAYEQQSWLQTTVQGPGTFHFYWKAESQDEYRMPWDKFLVAPTSFDGADPSTGGPCCARKMTYFAECAVAVVCMANPEQPFFTRTVRELF